MPQSRRLRAFWVVALTVVGLATIVASDEDVITGLRGVAEALGAVWRAGGNAFLTLNSPSSTAQRVLDFSDEPYPPAMPVDPTFFTQSDLTSLLQDDPASFELLCGVDTTIDEDERTTTLVAWSEDYWEGTSDTFSCGPGSSPPYEAAGAFAAAASICLVTDQTAGNRRNRCLSGPRCDDGMFNGTECDVDCGGSCGACQDGRSCTSSACCANGGTCQGGVCRNPTCTDNVRNQGETAVDCGGPCGGCSVGQACGSSNGNCAGSLICDGGVCAVQTTCSGAVATNSARNWDVYYNQINFCIGSQRYFANTFSEARGCASSDGLSVPGQICAYEVQVEPGWYTYPYASSQSNAVQCVRNTVCSNCSPVVTFVGTCFSQ